MYKYISHETKLTHIELTSFQLIEILSGSTVEYERILIQLSGLEVKQTTLKKQSQLDWKMLFT